MAAWNACALALVRHTHQLQQLGLNARGDVPDGTERAEAGVVAAAAIPREAQQPEAGISPVNHAPCPASAPVAAPPPGCRAVFLPRRRRQRRRQPLLETAPSTSRPNSGDVPLLKEVLEQREAARQHAVRGRAARARNSRLQRLGEVPTARKPPAAPPASASGCFPATATSTPGVFDGRRDELDGRTGWCGGCPSPQSVVPARP